MAAEPATSTRHADVFVIFGITGDLARVMTFRSLYRLEGRGLLDCPIVGVAFDDWTVDELVAHARDSIAATGEEVDDDVFARLAKRLSYHHGDFADAATYAEVAKAIEGKRTPVFYLEIRPPSSGRWWGASRSRGSPRTAVSSSRSRSGTTSRPLRARRGAPRVGRRVAAVPDRPLSRKAVRGGHRLPALREHGPRADLEPVLHRLGDDHDGRELRHRRPRTLLRPGRGDVAT